MQLRGFFLLNIFFFILVLTITSVYAEVIVEPFGTAVFIDEELEEEFVITLANDGDAEVSFEIGIDVQDIINPGEERQGPRRDLPEGRFAIFQDAATFGWVDEFVFRVIDGLDYEWFQNPADLIDVDLDEFDALWVETGNQSDQYRRNWDENLERFEDYVSGGKSMFIEQGHNEGENATHTTPGGLDYVWNPEEGTLNVGPEDNWLVDRMGWEEGQHFPGGNHTHVNYPVQNLENIEDCDFYQVIVVGDRSGAPSIIHYEYGRGNVIVSGSPCGHQWRNHNQDGRWGSCGEEMLEWLSLLSAPAWIQVEPEEGVIEPDGDADINVMLMAEEIEAGTHYAILEFELDDPDQPLIQIPVMMSIDAPIFDLFAVVTDETDGATLGQVSVSTYDYDFRRSTNNDGEIEILSLPSTNYDVHFSLTDYLPHVERFEVGDNDIWNLEISMRHSQCNLDMEEIVDELPVDEQSETVVTVSNDGNGPLTFTTDRRLLGDANAEPWELRVGVPAGVVVEDARVHGAVFINDQFYASGANDGDAAVYVLNRDQELIDQYAQLGESRYGYKDMATDGETIWGSGERIVFEFTPDGDEVNSFDCGISPCNNLAWDSDRDILWCSGTTTDIIGFDRDGNQIGEVDRQNLRIYGLAYWPDDPDGYQLYVYHKVREVGNLMVAKYDIENNQVMEVANLQHEIGGVAQGCFITNQYDIYSWVFMGTANSGAEDRIDIWQVDARKDWMEINPTDGVIEGGEQQEFTVTLDATGLPPAPFEGEIVFNHDGIGGETHLPITLQVGEGQGGGPEEMVLELANGWNMVSAYVQPDPDDVVEIMSELVEAETLVMVKNGTGQFYNPQFGFNNIPGWAVEEGYMIKMDGADELTLGGEPVPWDQAIELDAGWQMISYYPRQGVDAVLALSGIVDVLLMAKDGVGQFYSPAFGFSNMGDMIAGQGYLLKMDEAAELIYTVEEEVAAESSPNPIPNNLPIHLNTGENMSLLVFTDISEGEIGVYTNGNLVGSGVIQEDKCGIAVWGNDPSTSEVDGALKGETLEIRLNSGTESQAVIIEMLSGDNHYITDGFQAIRILDVQASPELFGIVDAYPNPFNSTTSLKINLPEAAKIDFTLYDITGRAVVEIASGHIKAGMHSFALDGSSLTSGVYVAQLQSSGKDYKQKLTLVK
mgnify:CR=1 FL=1